MTAVPFRKMDGAGNDFIIFDGRVERIALTPAEVRKIADRHHPITKGCDQVIVMEPSAKADVFMRIYNADGSEVSSCGNASRCVAWLMMQEKNTDHVAVETQAGIQKAIRAGDRLVTVDMGAPRFKWQEIPLAHEADTLELNIGEGVLQKPTAISMGNPHAVFFVRDANNVDLVILGPKLEHHPLFPERTNVEVAEPIDDKTIRLRVWERGAGETLACGTGACATLVAAHRRGLAGRSADIILPGGVLHVEWQGSDDKGHVFMTGPVTTQFENSVML